jgi:hypothetical protein
VCLNIIVHGLICGDSLGLFFVADFLGVFELGAPFRLVPPVFSLCFFEAVSSGVDSRVLFLVSDCSLRESVVGREPATSALGEVGRCLSVRADEYVTKGNGWVVLGVLCMRGRNRRGVDEFSCVGFGLPSFDNASLSQLQPAGFSTNYCVLCSDGKRWCGV